MYPLPIRPLPSHVLLTPEAVEALFGAGYALRGSERVEVAGRGVRGLTVEVVAGDVLLLTLGKLDRATGSSESPLSLIGPKGRMRYPAPSTSLVTTLVLPHGLLVAWDLEPGQRVALALGRLALTGVPVVEGPEAHVRADPAVLLAGEVEPDGAAYWLPDFTLPSDGPEGRRSDVSPPTAAPRLITENDVRQARRRHDVLRVAPGQLITPAARELGRELGVLDDGEPDARRVPGAER